MKSALRSRSRLVFSLTVFAFSGLAFFAFAPARAFAEDAEDEVLTILHTNDMHGHVLSSTDADTGPGGLARIVTMVREVRAEMPDTLFLDAGDITHGTPTEFLTQGAAMIRAMNAAGYDAATLGNHEFDWGQMTTAASIERASFPFLSANVHDVRTGGPYAGARESILVRRGDVRIAVFGLTTLETPGIEWPGNISLVRFEDPVATARRLVPELRRQADVVILLSHLGDKEDRQLAAAVPGIDIVIGGHSHTTISERVKVGETYIAQTGSYARNLGRMDVLMTQRDGHWRIASVNGEKGRWWADMADPPLGLKYPKSVLLPVAESIPPAPDVAGPYHHDWGAASKQLSETIAEAPATIPGKDSGKTVQPLPVLLAGLLREKTGADVALMPSAYGPEIPAGAVTAQTVYDIVGGYTRQNVVTVRASGKSIRAAVRKAYETEGEYPVYFAGVGGRVVRDGGTVRWEEATVNGRPLEDRATYLVAAGAYPLMDFPSLMESPVASDAVGWLKPLLVAAIRARKTITMPEMTLLLPPPPVTAETNVSER